MCQLLVSLVSLVPVVLLVPVSGRCCWAGRRFSIIFVLNFCFWLSVEWSRWTSADSFPSSEPEDERQTEELPPLVDAGISWWRTEEGSGNRRNGEEENQEREVWRTKAWVRASFSPVLKYRSMSHTHPHTHKWSGLCNWPPESWWPPEFGLVNLNFCLVGSRPEAASGKVSAQIWLRGSCRLRVTQGPFNSWYKSARKQKQWKIKTEQAVSVESEMQILSHRS